MKWTPEEDEVLRRLLAKGWTMREIADEIGRPFFGVEKRMARLGLVSKRQTKPAQPALRPAPAVVQVDPELIAAARSTVRRYAIDQADADELLAALGIAS